MSKIDLQIFPATEGAWLQYSQLCFDRYNYYPYRTDKTILVMGTDGEFRVIVAGCTLINTDGPFLYANNVVISRDVDRITQYNAAVFLQDELRKLSATMNRTVMMLSDHPGMISVLGKHGFTKHASELWFYNPSDTYVRPVFEVETTEVQRAETEPDEVFDDAVETNILDDEPDDVPKKRGRGRPKGSKNKKK